MGHRQATGTAASSRQLGIKAMSTLLQLLLLFFSMSTVIVKGLERTNHALRKGHDTFHSASNSEFIPGEKANDSLHTETVVDKG